MSHLRYGSTNMILEAVMVAVTVVFMFPLYLLVVLSLKPQSEVASSPLSLPQGLYLSNYTQAWASADLGAALVSSTITTATSAVFLVIFGSLAAYVLARRGTRLSYGMYILFLLGIILPVQTAIIPLYTLMKNANLLGTYTSVVIFYTGALLPFTIFLYTGFLRALPRSYEEAALVDGASHWQAFRRVVFPLLRPVTGTVLILNAITIWNDFFTPLLFLSGTERETLPVAIFSFVGEYVSQWGLVFAGLVISIIPILIVYFMLQRYIIRGFASGLKG
jgi:raffinose/stachyose/melibiose transport system permease protein